MSFKIYHSVIYWDWKTDYLYNEAICKKTKIFECVITFPMRE